MLKRFPIARLSVLSGACFALASPAFAASAVWVADQGDGTYKNPGLFADYSDPDVMRVGRDFYMTASSFNASPGWFRAARPGEVNSPGRAPD